MKLLSFRSFMQRAHFFVPRLESLFVKIIRTFFSHQSEHWNDQRRQQYNNQI